MAKMTYCASKERQTHHVFIKTRQSDDFLSHRSVSLVHLDGVDPGADGQRASDANGAVTAVSAQLQHSDRTVFQQQPVQNLTCTNSQSEHRSECDRLLILAKMGILFEYVCSRARRCKRKLNFSIHMLFETRLSACATDV